MNARRITALCILFGWLFAVGHVASRHGSVADAGVCCESAGHEEDQPDHDGHHHHDVAALGAGQVAKVEHKMSAPVVARLGGELWERLAVIAREALDPPARFDFAESPPDGRASGWLLVVHTARPVRGPSLT